MMKIDDDKDKPFADAIFSSSSFFIYHKKIVPKLAVYLECYRCCYCSVLPVFNSFCIFFFFLEINVRKSKAEKSVIENKYSKTHKNTQKKASKYFVKVKLV